MNAYKVEVVVAENGTVTLQGLPFRPGERVEVIVLERSTTPQSLLTPDARTTLDQEYLLSLETHMEEWASVEDEAAYRDL